MKKVSVLLCVVMLLSLLVGCGGGDNLTGTWEANIDVTETIGGGIIDEIAKSMPELNEYIDLSGLTLTIKTTFNEDGSYVSTVTEESFAAMMDTAASKAAEGLTNYINEIVADLKLDIDVSTIIGLNDGETVEDRLKAQFNSEDFKKIIENNAQSGVYRVKNGKLLTAETEEGFDEAKFETYVLNGDTLELTGAEGMDEDVVSIMTKKYPITYKKIG